MSRFFLTRSQKKRKNENILHIYSKIHRHHMKKITFIQKRVSEKDKVITTPIHSLYRVCKCRHVTSCFRDNES